MHYFGYWVISSAPEVFNMSETKSLIGQTTSNFVSFIDSSSNCVSFGLPSNKYFPSNQNSTMIASRDYLLNRFVLQPCIQLSNIVSNWKSDASIHTFPSHVLEVASKVNAADNTVCEDWVVITGWYKIDWFIDFDWDGNILPSLSTESSFIIATECEDCSVCGSNDGV